MIAIDSTAAPQLAQIHLESVDPAWSEDSFQALLQLPVVYGFRDQDFACFVLFSIIADEGEILTFATRPQFRRQGRGKKLLQECFNYFFKQKVEKFFLEVNENNFAAIQLYEQLDFKKYGRRESYYINSQGETAAAILMSR